MTNYEVPDDRDSFGVDRGNRYLETHNEAWEAALRWRPRAVGNRPHDWGMRDLIRGSALRERANWGYRMLARSGHLKLEADTDRMLIDQDTADKAFAELARSRAFLFFYYCGLFRQATYGTDERVMQSLINCPPNLFQIDNGAGYPLLHCRQVSRCPFCLARFAWKVFERVYSILRGQCQGFAILVSLSETLSVERPTDLTAAQPLAEVKNSQKNALRSLASQLNAEGGVISFQVLPRFLGEAKFVDGDIDIDPTEVELVARSAMIVTLSDRFIAAFAEHFDHGTDFPATAIGDVPGLGEWVDGIVSDRACRVHFKHLASPGALRGLVVGTTPGRRGHSRREGIEGLFVAPQWQLVPPELMSRLEHSLKRFRISDSFGNWRGTSEPRRPARQVYDGAHQRRTEQLIRLSGANSRRKDCAEDQARQHLSAVSPIFNQLANELGQAPGRKRLQTACHDAGHDISERQIRRLIPLLRIGASI